MENATGFGRISRTYICKFMTGHGIGHDFNRKQYVRNTNPGNSGIV